MKIFSWVHRQFHHKVAKNDEIDKLPLLENEGFDGWKEGILAIGTFGVDLIHDFKAKEDALNMNNSAMLFDDDGDDHDDEMESPLVVKASKHDVFDHVEIEKLSLCDEVAKTNNYQEDVIVNTFVKIRSRERITLADLLQADDSEKNAFNHKIKAHNAGNESNKSFFISKAKKKVVKDDSAQLMIKRTKQLLRKMLKKKIHPDNGIRKLESPSIVCQEMDVHAI